MNEAEKSGKKEKEDIVEREIRLRDKHAALAQRALARRKMTERKKELARDIIIGRIIRQEEREKDNSVSLLKRVDGKITRNIDRELFDLPLLPEESKVKRAKPGVTTSKEPEKVE